MARLEEPTLSPITEQSDARTTGLLVGGDGLVPVRPPIERARRHTEREDRGYGHIAAHLREDVAGAVGQRYL